MHSAATEVNKPHLNTKSMLYIRQDVPTRWNSTFLMFERFVHLKPALLEMLGSQEYRSHHKVLQKVKQRDWVVMANVVTVLQVKFSEFQV